MTKKVNIKKRLLSLLLSLAIISGMMPITAISVTAAENTDEKNAGSYKITFDANGGECAEAEATADSDNQLASLPTPTRSCYSFDGWYTAAEGGDMVTTEKVYSENTTLYAHWTPVYWTDEGNYDISWYNAEATRYTLEDAADLAGLAVLVNGLNGQTAVDFSYQISGIPVKFPKIIEIKNDIDLSGKLWTPIGTLDNPLMGSFDGKGKTIKNMTVKVTKSFAGLFGNIGKTGNSAGILIHNINIVSSQVTATGNDAMYIAGIAGNLSSGTLTDCTYNGSVSAESQFVAGIIAASEGSSVKNCVNYATVTAIGTQARQVGGIVGDNMGGLGNCANFGDVTGYLNVGGIAGKVTSYSLTNCYNIGKISNTENSEDASGAIAGYVDPSSISINYCYFLEGTADEALGSAKAEFKTTMYKVNKTAFESGEIAYKLNGEVGGGTGFYQNLDNGKTVDTYPLPNSNHGKVYKTTKYTKCDKSDTPTVVYSNTDKGDDAPEHVYQYSASGNVITETCKNCAHSATATITLDTSGTFEYETNKKHEPTATVTCSDNWGGGTLIVNYENNINAGNNTATAYIVKNDAKAMVNFSIEKAVNQWTTTPDIEGWTYGETAKTPNVAAKLGNVSVTYTGTANDGTPYNDTTAPIKAGTYKAAFTVTETDNYNGLSAEVSFSIAKTPITVTADDTEKSYGDSDPAVFTWTKTGGTLYNGDTLSGISVTRENGEKADTYAIKATESKNANPNYDITFVDGTFTINKAVLTVTADNKTAIYGDAVPTYTVTYSGFKNSETADILGGTLAFECDYAQFSNKGDYAITPKGLVSDNYTFNYKNGTLSVSAKKITVAIDGKTSVYGNDIVALTATDNGIVQGDKEKAVYSLSTAASKNAGIGFYDIIGTALNDNYSITFTGGTNAYEITKRNLTVNVVVNDKQYDGLNTASIKSAELNNIANNDSITLVNGTPTFDSVNTADGIGITFTDFMLSGAEEVLKNYQLVQPEGITANITNGWNPENGTEYITSTPNANGWVKEDFIVSAKDGYELSFTNTADGSWIGSIFNDIETADGSVSFYVRNKETGAISEQATVTYKLDKNTETTGTTGTVGFVGRSSWQEFVNTITFGLFYKDEVTVKAEANDGLSGVDSIEYAVSDKAMSLEKVQAITDWTALPENGISVSLEDQKLFVYFIRVTDKAGNVIYLSTDGAEYDTTLPAIDGIENGGIYHTTQVITIADKNLESVTLNDEPITLENDGKLTLEGNMEKTYVIRATDKAGNVTEYTVTMKAVSSIMDPIKDTTVDNVTSADKEKLEAVIEEIEKELENGDLTDEEEKALEKEKQKAEELLKKLEETANASKTENTDKVKDITAENVKTEDQKNLEKAKADLEKALKDHQKNLTDAEKKNLEKEIARIEKALEVIKKAEEAKKAEQAATLVGVYEHQNGAKDTAGADAPATGDSSDSWLWIGCALASGCILLAAACGRKRKETE